MKKRVYLNYAAFFFFLLLIYQIFLLLFLFGYTEKQNRARMLEKLEETCTSVKESVIQWTELRELDLKDLIHYEVLRLQEIAEGSAGEGTEILIVDLDGELLAYTEGRSGQSLGKGIIELAREKASENSFSSDLGGFFSKEQLCRVMLLEQQYRGEELQTVGAVFVTVATESEFSQYAGEFLMGTLFFMGLIFLVVCLFGYLVYMEMIRPLQQLDNMARSFSKDDYSYRLDENKAGEMIPLFRTMNSMAERMEETEDRRQSLIANLSHDLRTPLTTIGGFIQNMNEGIIPPERQGHYFGIIQDEVSRLARLVQTLLETGRMASGKRKYQFEPMDLCELGRITLLSFEKRLEEKALEVSFEATEDSLFVLADPDAIQQVIYNLLDNAVKFVPSEGSLSIRVEKKEKKVFFSVKNSGEGIPEEELSHLFDRFYKSDRSRGLDKKGMGLGLFIAKSVIHAHGEEIWVESRQGDYTRFVFSLPATQQRPKKTVG